MNEDLYFDDDGSPVPIEIPAQDRPQTLQALLREHGLTQSEIDMVDDRIDDEATVRAAELIRVMLLKLDGTAAAVALRRVVLGVGSGETLREEAKRLGCSHVAILKAEKITKRRLGLPASLLVEE